MGFRINVMRVKPRQGVTKLLDMAVRWATQGEWLPTVVFRIDGTAIRVKF
jgi:hypothetical protein